MARCINWKTAIRPSPSAVRASSHTTSFRLKSSMPEMLFSGFGSFPASIQRLSVDRLMPSCLTSCVPLTHLSPVIDARLACMALCRQSL